MSSLHNVYRCERYFKNNLNDSEKYTIQERLSLFGWLYIFETAVYSQFRYDPIKHSDPLFDIVITDHNCIL